MFMTKSEKERQKWMTLKEAVEHISKLEGIELARARQRLIAFISEKRFAAMYDDDPSALRKSEVISREIYKIMTGVDTDDEKERTRLSWPYRPQLTSVTPYRVTKEDFRYPRGFPGQAETIDWNASTIHDAEFSARRPLVVMRSAVEAAWGALAGGGAHEHQRDQLLRSLLPASTISVHGKTNEVIKTERVAEVPPAETQTVVIKSAETAAAQITASPKRRRGPKTGGGFALKDAL